MKFKERPYFNVKEDSPPVIFRLPANCNNDYLYSFQWSPDKLLERNNIIKIFHYGNFCNTDEMNFPENIYDLQHKNSFLRTM